jgi:hypothetical protein
MWNVKVDYPKSPLPMTINKGLSDLTEIMKELSARFGVDINANPAIIDRANEAPILAMDFRVSDFNLKAAPVAKIIRDFISKDSALSGILVKSHVDQVGQSPRIRIDMEKIPELTESQLAAIKYKANVFNPNPISKGTSMTH